MAKNWELYWVKLLENQWDHYLAQYLLRVREQMMDCCLDWMMGQLQDFDLVQCSMKAQNWEQNWVKLQDSHWDPCLAHNLLRLTVPMMDPCLGLRKDPMQGFDLALH
jgi:hypothetical protein